MDRTAMMQRVGHLQQWGGTRLVTLEDGSERGVRAVEFRTTAGLEFAVLIDRGMDIGWARYQGRSIAWHSQTGFVSPAYAEVDAGMGWLKTFSGGLFNSSGLDHALFPETDPHDTYGEAARASGTSYGIHGRVSTIPGRLIAYGEQWRDDVCYLYAEAEVDQATGLGEHLRLVRRVETTLDGMHVSWTDRVENVWHLPTPHMFLYHTNLGAPLLDESCELLIPSVSIRWTTPNVPDNDPEVYRRLVAPQPGFEAQAFEHEMTADPDGRVEVALVNRNDESRPWGVVMEYDSARFPFFFQWRFLAVGNYLTAFEPSTNSALGRAHAREAGELTMLESGEWREATTTLRILDGVDACDATAARIAALLAH